MLLFIVIVTLYKLYCSGYKLISNSVIINNTKLNNRLNAKSNVNNLNFNFLSNLHNEAFEHPEFQLHIPPVSTFLPKINYNLTNLDTLNRIVNNSNSDDDSTNDKESNELVEELTDNILDQNSNSDYHSNTDDQFASDNNFRTHIDTKSLTSDFRIDDINELDNTDKDYIDGPLDVIKMANDGKLLEYRYMYNNLNNMDEKLNKNLVKTELVDSVGKQNTTLIQKIPNNTKLDNRLDNKLFSYKNEIPPDVFILNYSIVDLGYREYIYTACKVLTNLNFFELSDDTLTTPDSNTSRTDKDHNKNEKYIKNKDVDKTSNKVKINELFNNVFDNKIPNWLSLSFYYSLPYTDGLNDYIYLLHNFIKNYEKSSYYLKSESLNDIDSIDLIRSNLENIENWKQNGLYDEISKLFTGTDLDQLFMEERGQLRKKNSKLYINLVKFKNHSNVSYNISLTQLINYYINVIKMPIYILSNVENKNEVIYRLRLFGVKPSPLLNVLELNTDTNHISNTNQNNTTGSNNTNNSRSNTNFVLEEFLNNLNLNKLIPVHYFDNSFGTLNNLLTNPRFNNLRLYFTDWGSASNYNHKLLALYSDRLKYIKETKKLIEFICKFSSVNSREWTHGYRLRYPDEEKLDFLYSWKALYSSSSST